MIVRAHKLLASSLVQDATKQLTPGRCACNTNDRSEDLAQVPEGKLYSGRWTGEVT